MMAAQRRSPRRRFLTIATICLVLALLFCGVGWFFVLRHAVSYAETVSAFDARIAKEFPDGTRWGLPPPAEGAPVTLLLGLPAAPAPDEVAGTQDRFWRIYVSEFAEGGVGVQRVGIGQAAGRALGEEEGPEHYGKVIGWQANAVDAADLAARTGLAAPPLHTLIQIEGDEFFQTEETRDDE
jgi:hypothetical protein